jgi:ceramide glucosyltransferase
MTIFIICTAISIGGIILYLFQVGATCSLIKKKPHCGGNNVAAGCRMHSLPPVSILKPLKGLDDNLFDNLSSFCTQNYPEYEILFSLQDHNDLAYKVAKKVRDKYPDCNISIVVEKCSVGFNPKVNNLIPAYRVSRHPYILISDSNIMVDKSYLQKIMQYTKDPSIGLVSNMIYGVGGRTIGAIFENLHLNSFIIGSVSFLDKFLGMPCVIGKSMLMKKEDLEKLGGLTAFKDVLAEDFIIGREMHRFGKKVALSNHLISNVNEYWDVKRFLNRHTRWGKLRWKIGGYKYFSELLGNPVFIATLPVLFMGPSITTLSLTGLISLIKVLGDALIGKAIESSATGNDMQNRSPFTYILGPIKDVIIGIIWFVPILNSTVVWRGNRYRIGKDSRLSPCPETGVWSWRYRITDVIRAQFA